MKVRVRHLGDFRWDGVPLLAYKPEDGHFRDVSRQVLFGPDAGPPCELRYFEIGPDGHSTLERHDHAHAVMVVRGRGCALVGREILELEPFDLLRVPSRTWHQLRAGADEALGFLCLVPCERDRPERPDAEALLELRRDPEVGRFIRS